MMPKTLAAVACRAAVTLAASAALALNLGCEPGGGGGGAAGSSYGQAEAEFVFSNRGEVTVLDPNKMSWMQDIRVGQGLYEGIYTLDPETLDPILGAASEVTHSDDYKTWDITIRDDAKWSNGDDLTADDFVFAWRRNLREYGDYSSLVSEYVAGADDYKKAYQEDPRAADFSQVGIVKTGEKSLRVELAFPVPYFPDLLAFVSYWPVHEGSMAEFKQTADDGREFYDLGFTNPGKLVTNGPYKLDEWQRKQGLTLAMNEHYWDKDSVKSRTIRCLDLKDHNLAYQRYEDGQIDWLTDIPGEFANSMREAGRTDLRVFPAYGTYFWTFNTHPTLPDGSDNPLAETRVRQALAAAIDKVDIVETIKKMGEMPTDVYVPKNAEYFDGYRHPEGIATDVERANALLDEAGFEDRSAFPKLKMLYNTDTGDHAAVAENLARQWREKLGLEFDLDPVESAQFKQRYSPKLVGKGDEARLEPGDFAIARGSWYGDYMDVSTFTDKYRATGGNNDAVWVNERYNELLDEAKLEADPQRRLDLLAEAEGILVTEVPILPLYHYVNTYILDEDVTGIPENPRMMISMKNVATPRSTGPGVGRVDKMPAGMEPVAHDHDGDGVPDHAPGEHDDHAGHDHGDHEGHDHAGEGVGTH